MNKLKESLDQNPRESVRQRSGDLQISKSSIGVGAKILGFYPYRVSCVQKLKESDYPKRVNYCN